MTMKQTCAAIALACICATAAPFAQEAAENRNPVTRLDDIKALDCTFTARSQVSWAKDGTPSTKAMDTAPVLNVKVKINAGEGTGQFLVPSEAEAVVQQYGWNMHIMEPSRSGRLTMLTVFGRVSRDNKLKAVHTRTDYLPVDLPGFINEPEATQYYGECTPTR